MTSGASGTHVSDAAASGFGVQSVFQPIVSLPEGAVVGFEALARWPTLGNPAPHEVFARAAVTGTLEQLDRTCIDSALETALARNLPAGTLLLLNCEPMSGYVDRHCDRMLARAGDQFRVVFELTERSLLKSPRALLRKVAKLRDDGFGIALDDVGAHPDSLALLDVICPDVIKLDLHLIQVTMGDDQARVLAAVLAHQERTGSVLLAEGIESEEHLEQALALGATLGQGYRYGRAESLTGKTSVDWSPPPMKHPVRSDGRSPFDVVAGRAAVRTARKAVLIPFSRHIETQAAHATDPPMMLASLQRAENFSGSTRRRYRDIAATSPMVAVFGRGLDGDLGRGIRGVELDADDPLCAEWVVLMLGPHHAAALVAREQNFAASLSDDDRRFDMSITYDRVLVTVAARNLLERVR
ncbi:EAL domain-containing protein [Mycolicibacterium sp. 050158]|uniref:sensor domain-containing phosphodiesterase n=1 Tax=Mycolicibacterium sp. 050158 TaxID=3090602 RepID=UPI00299E5AC0|nr:EAL domain-containing protein [Mycolicibacterium sp. 050158]MDX1892162.1 EAL domain-containing protein [Mycolicibacterium sp. 050158]